MFKMGMRWLRNLKRFIYQRTTPLPDLSRNYMDLSIPAKQRDLIDPQLQEMYAGRPPRLFTVLVDTFGAISDLSVRTKLLDAGCGSGYYNEILSHLVPVRLNYFGMDFNQGMLQLARQKYPQLRLARMDLRNVGWLDQSFDVVLSGAVIVHIREWQEAVVELSRVAKKWLVLHRTVVYLEKPSFIRVEHHYDVDVYRVFIEERELISLLRGLGFRLNLKVDCNEGEVNPDVGEYTYLFSREPATFHA